MVGQDSGECAACGRPLLPHFGYVIGGQCRCLRCALRYRPLLRRSGATALVVGTVLVLINQGSAFVDGSASLALLWKIPLTYLVPFCVATWGALSNSRASRNRSAGHADGRGDASWRSGP